MPPTAKAPAGVLVISAWVEADAAPGTELRARITSTSDVLSGDKTTRVVAGVEAVGDAVRAWLEEILPPQA